MRTTFSSVRDVDSLLDEWRRLHAMSGAGFFLSPPWIATLLTAAPGAVDFGVIRVLDDLRGVYGIALVGVSRQRSFPSLREARLHETGIPAVDRTYIEYNDILLARGAPDGSREAAIDVMIDELPKIDELVFRNARPAFASAVREVAARRKGALRTLGHQPTYWIELSAPSDGSIFNRFSPSLRSKIRRSIRKYEERGAVEIQPATTESERTVAWTELMRLHADTWSRRGKAGVFGEPAFAAFHERLIEDFPNSIDLIRLTVGNETVGVLYNLISAKTVCNYQSGFRYEADNQLVPGFVCHALAADYYREKGFSSYDMMGGDAEYKRRLGREGETLSTLVLTRPGLRTAARISAEAIKRVPGVKMRRT